MTFSAAFAMTMFICLKIRKFFMSYFGSMHSNKTFLKFVKAILACLIIVFACAYVSEKACAQNTLSLTVTPPLFQLSIKPGDTWSSSLKVVNTNPRDLTLYASAMNFAPQGEGGRGKFTPITNEDAAYASHSLARWIEISGDALDIPQGQSKEIPFSVRIPADAEPGGHYAAILVGTRPAEQGGGSHIAVASYVSSLLFIRIGGNASEEGSIREFYTEKTFLQSQDASFVLRFENIGNVHLQPQGDITVYNMWGKERGMIPINQKTDFGNVLPSSIRKFVFEWKGEDSLFEAGKYKAIATLSFGSAAKQSVSATTYFWVLPVKPLLGVLGGIAMFILIMIWAIRSYVRRVLRIEAALRGITMAGVESRQQQTPSIRTSKWTGPVKESIADLKALKMGMRVNPAARTQDIAAVKAVKPEKPALRRENPDFSGMHVDNTQTQRSIGPMQFARKHAYLLAFAAIMAGSVAAVSIFFSKALIPSRSYQVYIQEEDGRKVKLIDLAR
jgi:hypothetical protein